MGRGLRLLLPTPASGLPVWISRLGPDLAASALRAAATGSDAPPTGFSPLPPRTRMRRVPPSRPQHCPRVLSVIGTLPCVLGHLLLAPPPPVPTLAVTSSPQSPEAAPFLTPSMSDTGCRKLPAHSSMPSEASRNGRNYYPTITVAIVLFLRGGGEPRPPLKPLWTLRFALRSWWSPLPCVAPAARPHGRCLRPGPRRGLRPVAALSPPCPAALPLRTPPLRHLDVMAWRFHPALGQTLDSLVRLPFFLTCQTGLIPGCYQLGFTCSSTRAGKP